ncbi:nucleotide exchange factor SIL1 isoform X3 [Telopea speciosissima]|uniref:nucleotide exchange factor SIL1 isoform X3 n=1 Tax=Telopea speciosissima TaxID=54955 RepID=UPI001CC34A92|nr:nucleotide exchange factor SIL1 isoform X3 [Telopea speciosissima]
MGRRQARFGLVLWLLLMLCVVAQIAGADSINNSTLGGLLWTSTKVEANPRKSELEESVVGNENNDNNDDEIEFSGGFSSLDGMLQWAIDLNKLGGLAVVILELDNSNPEIRSTSAWIIGKASQNNPVVQKQIIELGALKKLMEMLKSSSAEEAAKVLYAVSALIRGNLDGQELFYAEGGDLILQDMMRNSSIDIRLRRKSVSLLADLAEFQLVKANKQEFPFFSNPFFLKTVVNLMSSTDLDLQEKALMAIKSILQLRTTETLVHEDFCGLDEVLERMQKNFQQSISEECQNDFVRDLESLRGEVEIIFHSKLEKGTFRGYLGFDFSIWGLLLGLWKTLWSLNLSQVTWVPNAMNTSSY